MHSPVTMVITETQSYSQTKEVTIMDGLSKNGTVSHKPKNRNFCSKNIAHSPVTMEITKTQFWT